MNKLSKNLPILLRAFSYILFLCLNNSFKSLTLVAAQAVPVKVGVVLDMESIEGKIGLSSINMAIADFDAAHPQSKTRIVLHVRNCKHHDTVMAAAAGKYVMMLLLLISYLSLLN